MFLSIEANTVIDPWTVMVHFSNTSLAGRTVVRVRRLDTVALLTFLGQQVIEVLYILLIKSYLV